MLIFWVISFEIAVLYFCSSTLRKCRLATPRLAWVGFALMVLGIIINNAIVLLDRIAIEIRDFGRSRADAIMLLASNACDLFFSRQPQRSSA